MKTVSEISGRLRSALDQSKLRQLDLAESAGVARQTLTKVLSGREDFKVSTLLALADKLGLELVMVPKGAAEGLHASTGAPAVESLVDRVRKGLKGPGVGG